MTATRKLITFAQNDFCCRFPLWKLNTKLTKRNMFRATVIQSRMCVFLFGRIPVVDFFEDTSLTNAHLLSTVISTHTFVLLLLERISAIEFLMISYQGITNT